MKKTKAFLIILILISQISYGQQSRDSLFTTLGYSTIIESEYFLTHQILMETEINADNFYRGKPGFMTMGFHLMVQHAPTLIGAVIGSWSHRFKVIQARSRRLIRWARRRYKRYKSSPRRARQWFNRVREQFPGLLYHWQVGITG